MRVFAAAAVLLVLFVLPAAGQWAGEERDVDGVTHVLNPGEPMLAPQTVELTEMWRLGGYSDAPEEFFGVISDIVADEENNFYVVDAQLSEVRVFDQSGAYVNTIGREGEGPGEFRMPVDLNIMPDGTIGVVQPRPSKLIQLTKMGDPAGDYSITVSGEGFVNMQSVTTVGDNLAVVYGLGNFDRKTQTFTRSVRLGVFDLEGNELSELTSAVASSGSNTEVYREIDWTNFERAWSAAREGTIAARTSLTNYEVTVWNADGTTRHVVEVERPLVARTSEYIEAREARWEASIRRWVQDAEFDILPNHYPVQDVHVREDGTMWVRSAEGTHARPDGALASFDVFDAAGRYERQLTMNGQFDPEADGLFVSGAYLLVVTDLQSAREAAMGGVEGDDVDADAEPMEIICYRMELAPLAQADK